MQSRISIVWSIRNGLAGERTKRRCFRGYAANARILRSGTSVEKKEAATGAYSSELDPQSEDLVVRSMLMRTNLRGDSRNELASIS
jgi:hypothetical protein